MCLGVFPPFLCILGQQLKRFLSFPRAFHYSERESPARRRQLQGEGEGASQHPRAVQRGQRVHHREAERGGGAQRHPHGHRVSK